jgi:hypothetical protein
MFRKDKDIINKVFVQKQEAAVEDIGRGVKTLETKSFSINKA